MSASLCSASCLLLSKTLHDLPVHGSCFVVARLAIPAPVELAAHTVMLPDILHLHRVNAATPQSLLYLHLEGLMKVLTHTSSSVYWEGSPLLRSICSPLMQWCRHVLAPAECILG